MTGVRGRAEKRSCRGFAKTLRRLSASERLTRPLQEVVGQPEAERAAVTILLSGFRALPDPELGIQQVAEFGLEGNVITGTPAKYQIELGGPLLELVRRAKHADFGNPFADKVVEHRGLDAAIRIIVAGLQIDDQRGL